MKLDTVSMSVVGATIVLALSTASAQAQAKPKSQKRIPISKESGGEVFSIGSAAKIGEVTRRIEEELRSQYVLAFRTDSQKPPGQYREVKVAVAKPGISVRTIRGYIP